MLIQCFVFQFGFRNVHYFNSVVCVLNLVSMLLINIICSSLSIYLYLPQLIQWSINSASHQSYCDHMMRYRLANTHLAVKIPNMMYKI